MSVELDRFERSLVEGGRQWLDDFDLDALTKLQGVEQARALEALESRLGQGDPRVPRALLSLGANYQPNRVQAGLRAALPAAGESEEAVEIALALWQLTADLRTLDTLTAVLTSGDTSARIRAAAALRLYPKPVGLGIAKTTLRDKDPTVRFNAAMSAMAFYAVDSLTGKQGAPPNRWVRLMMTEIPELQQEAEAELTDALNAMDGSETAQSLGLDRGWPDPSPACRRFLTSYRTDPGEAPWADSFDLDAMAQLQGAERERARIGMWAELHRGDPRAVAGLVTVGSDKDVALMRKYAHRFEQAVSKAISALD